MKAEPVDGSFLHVQGTVANGGAMPIRVGYGACSFRIRLFRTAERTEPAAWDSKSQEAGLLCQMYLVTGVLGPYASIQPREYARSISAGELSLADGTYFAAVTMGLANPPMFSDEIPAGTLVVKRPR